MVSQTCGTPCGQYEYPDGLFYGGTAPSWSNGTLRTILRKYCRDSVRLGWIDIHTGLGPTGHGERIFAGFEDASSLARARTWWDGKGLTPVTSIYEGSSTSAKLSGMMFGAIRDEAPLSEYTGIIMEFGTSPSNEVISALRAEQWLQLKPTAPVWLANQIKAQMLSAFYIDTDAWKEAVIHQTQQAMYEAVEGLISNQNERF